MAKPIVRAITPFDATIGTTINFTWSGRQMKSATAIIKNASTGAQVYTATQSTYKGTFDIPPDSGLVNNTNYKVSIFITDMDDTESEASDDVLFSCYTMPTITMQRLYGAEADDITDGFVCDYSNIYIRLKYEHPVAETGNLLNTWKIYLYDSSKAILDFSNDMLATETLDYEFSGLMDLAEYYLRIEGITTSGMPLDTGFVRITVSYSIPAKFANLSLVNNPEEGNIHVQSYAVSITGRAKQEPVEYLYDENDEPYAVDLTNGNEVTFNEGIYINKEFNLTMHLSRLKLFKTFLKLSDGENYNYELRYWRTKVPNGYKVKAVFSPLQDSVLGANYMPLPDERTINGITLTHNSDRTITLNGTATDDAVFKVAFPRPLVSKSYQIYAFNPVANPNVSLSAERSDGVVASTSLGETNANTGTGSATADLTFVAGSIIVASGTSLTDFIIKPMVAVRSGLSFEPFKYSYPIEGRTGVTFVQAGTNLLAPPTVGQSIDTQTGEQITATAKYAVSDYIPVNMQLHSYTVSYDKTVFSHVPSVEYFGIKVCGYNKNKEYLGITYSITQNPKTFTYSSLKSLFPSSVDASSIRYIRFYLEASTDASASQYYFEQEEMTAAKFNMNVGESVLDYVEAQEIKEYPVSWSDSAGTIYSGTIDVGAGTLEVDGALVTLTGAETIGTGGDNGKQYMTYKLGPLGYVKEYGESLSSILQNNPNIADSNEELGFKVINSSAMDGAYLIVRPKLDMSLEDYTSWLTELNGWGQPVQFYYELGTPVTYQLDVPDVPIKETTANVYDIDGAADSIVVSDMSNAYQLWLYGNNNGCSYSLWSNSLSSEPSPTDNLAVLLSRDKNGIFSLKWINLSEGGD